MGVDKLRFGGGDQNVASHCDLETPSRGHAIDCADHRALELQQCGHGIEIECTGGVRDALAQFVKVQSGAERAASACENERAHR